MDENEHPKGALVFMLIYLVTLAGLWPNAYLRLWRGGGDATRNEIRLHSSRPCNASTSSPACDGHARSSTLTRTSAARRVADDVGSALRVER